jgi:DNA-directed RNA polymerase subunit RPC12/RpoP
MGPEIKCEKCGGKEIINISPNSYEYLCTKCGHKFVWIKHEESEEYVYR